MYFKNISKTQRVLLMLVLFVLLLLVWNNHINKEKFQTITKKGSLKSMSGKQKWNKPMNKMNLHMAKVAKAFKLNFNVPHNKHKQAMKAYLEVFGPKSKVSAKTRANIVKSAGLIIFGKPISDKFRGPKLQQMVKAQFMGLLKNKKHSKRRSSKRHSKRHSSKKHNNNLKFNQMIDKIAAKLKSECSGKKSSYPKKRSSKKRSSKKRSFKRGMKKIGRGIGKIFRKRSSKKRSSKKSKKALPVIL